MNYVIVGINHKTAPIELREKLALPSERISQVLDQVLGCAGIKETAVLSTCNRVEIYGVTSDPSATRNALSDYFISALQTSGLKSCLYTKTDADAVSHLFAVTASLDALVVGENQITNQVKEAFRIASDRAATGPYLNRLFNRAFFVAKRVKTETDIGKGNVSVGSVAVKLAKKIFGTLAGKSVTLLGAGEVGELVLRHLGSNAAGRTFIVNRNIDKAARLEMQGLGEAHRMDNFDACLLESDILITSLSSGYDGLDKKYFETVMQRRNHNPLFVIDLGVPRNVDKAAGAVDNVYLYNIDDFTSVAEESGDRRESELLAAKNIIDEETRLFYESYLDREALPTIAGLSKKFEDIRRRECQKTLARMPHWNHTDATSVETLTKAIVARILYDPILHLKNRQTPPGSPMLGVLKKIFSLDDEVEDE